MRMVPHRDVALATEAFGKPADPAVLLVMGATASMLGWPEEFCTLLAGHGFYVIRFDHRDTGQSTTVPPGAASYAVEDMAADVVAILDSYGIRKAHFVGMSLGGYIAQMVALKKAERVLSLTLIAAEPLGWDGAALPGISDAFLGHFGKLGGVDWTDAKLAGAFLLETERLCAGPAHPFDEGRARALIGRVMSRTDSLPSMFNHAGLTVRENWTGRFRDIRCPVLVIHGTADPVLPVENGRALAAGIGGAVLWELEGVGHELPAPLLFAIAERIAAHLQGPA